MDLHDALTVALAELRRAANDTRLSAKIMADAGDRPLHKHIRRDAARHKACLDAIGRLANWRGQVASGQQPNKETPRANQDRRP